MREVKSSQNQGLDDFCSDNQSASKQLNTLQIKHFLKYCVGSILERAAFSDCSIFEVRIKGLEPPRLSASDPKSDVATNYTISALG